MHTRAGISRLHSRPVSCGEARYEPGAPVVWVSLDFGKQAAGDGTRAPEFLLPGSHGRWIDAEQCREGRLAHREQFSHAPHGSAAVWRRRGYLYVGTVNCESSRLPA